MALVLVVAPILIAFAQFFGGEQIRGGCPIGDMPCTQVRTPGPFPLIGTRDGVIAVTTALGIGWITSAAVLAGSFWRRDRQAAVRMALVMVGAAFMAGVMAFGAGYIAGRRLLAGAEAATIATFIVGLLALIVGLGASARPHSRRFDPPDPTRVPWRAAGLIGLVGILVVAPVLALGIRIAEIVGTTSCGVSPNQCVPGVALQIVPGVAFRSGDAVIALVVAWIAAVSVLAVRAARRDPRDLVYVIAVVLVGMVVGGLIGSSTSSALAGAVVAAVPALVVVTGRGHPSSRAARFAPGDR